ncbi:MAG: 50S ribosomal protein L5 [Planctomycetes bacterium]|jgi:large subunit ribosomal protein L5|nr:50S ribosomal protein L5 [Planctomycetota bacterium]
MRLKELYKKTIVPKLKEQFGYQNSLEAPKLVKVVVNVGFGRQAKEKAHVDNVAECLRRITGQKPVFTKAKKSVSAFKIRQGMVIGAAVTLRGARMYDFTEKLVNVTFPRVRDFRGLNPKAVDRTGSLTVGFREYLPFPEIKGDEVENIFGLEVCLATSAHSRDEGLALFTLLGFPFQKPS